MPELKFFLMPFILRLCFFILYNSSLKNSLKKWLKICIVIVLSNDPAPKKIEGWHLVAEQEYDMNGAKRYFWALSVWNART